MLIIEGCSAPGVKFSAAKTSSRRWETLKGLDAADIAAGDPVVNPIPAQQARLIVTLDGRAFQTVRRLDSAVTVLSISAFGRQRILP